MTKSYKKPFLILFLIVATELIGFGLIIPIFPQLSLKFQSNPYLLGFLMAAYSLAQFFAAPILGALSDRYGRKKILLLSKLGTVFAYIILGLSQSYMGFLIARLLDGFTGGNISVARAYVADITSPEDRPKGMAIIGISFGVGFILGPALGGFLYGTSYGHLLPALVAGGLSLLAFVFTLMYLEEPEKHRQSDAAIKTLFSGFKYLTSFIIAFICLSQLIYMIMFSGFETTLSIFTQYEFGLTEKDNSWLFVYAGVLGLIIQGSIARKTPKNMVLVIALGFAAVAIGFIGFAKSFTLIPFLAFLAVMSLGIALVNVYLPSLMSKMASSENQGAVMGVFEGVSSLSRILGPLIAYSSMMSVLRFGYFVYGLILLAFMIVFLIVFRNKNTG